MRLAELGWLHNRIREYTDQRSLDRSLGLVGQVRASLVRHRGFGSVHLGRCLGLLARCVPRW